MVGLRKKKGLAFLVAVCLLMGIFPSAAAAPLLGELDGSAGISAGDALRVLQYSVKLISLNEEEKEAADVDGSGQIDAADALMILQYTVGLIGRFEADDTVYRVLLASDIHCTHLAEWYGVSNDDRMQHWVDSVLKEHEIQPIDLLLLLGDYSLDHWVVGTGGSWLNEGISTTELFFKEYVSQLPDEIEIFAVAGNHEQFGDEKWVELTGNHRQGAVTLGDNLFLMLDTFGTNLDPTQHSDGTYLPADVEFIRQQMAAHPNKKVYLCAHWLDGGAESAEFRDITYDDRVKALFMGHNHLSTASPYTGLGLKPLAYTGNFSYTNDQNTEDSFWGFRELMIFPDNAISRYIVVESQAVVNGQPFSVDRHYTDSVIIYQ